MRLTRCVVLVAALAACPSKKTGPSVKTPVDFCSSYAEASVSHAISCIGMTPTPETEAFGKASLIRNCSKADAVASGRVTFDATAAEKCVANIATTNCLDDEYDKCMSTVYKGTVAVGGPCYSDIDCVNGSCNRQHGGCTAGVCIAWLALNDDCNSSAGWCGPNLDCDSTSGKCIATTSPGELNKPCGTGSKCQSGLHCDNITNPASPTCQAAKSTGPCVDNSACTPDRQCSHANLTGSTGTCAPYLPYGADCSAYPDTCIDGVCGVDHKCTNFPTIGQNCVVNGDGLVCVDSWCDSNGSQKCEAFKQIGDKCIQGNECGYSATCESSTCQAQCLQ